MATRRVGSGWVALASAPLVALASDDGSGRVVGSAAACTSTCSVAWGKATTNTASGWPSNTARVGAMSDRSASRRHSCSTYCHDCRCPCSAPTLARRWGPPPIQPLPLRPCAPDRPPYVPLRSRGAPATGDGASPLSGSLPRREGLRTAAAPAWRLDARGGDRARPGPTSAAAAAATGSHSVEAEACAGEAATPPPVALAAPATPSARRPLMMPAATVPPWPRMGSGGSCPACEWADACGTALLVTEPAAFARRTGEAASLSVRPTAPPASAATTPSPNRTARAPAAGAPRAVMRAELRVAAPANATPDDEPTGGNDAPCAGS